MSRFIVLAGPTLDRALGLVRLGLLSANPSSVRKLERGECSASMALVESIRNSAETPPELKLLLDPRASEPVHLYVPNMRDAHRGRIVCHVLGQTYPAGSFFELCPYVLVPSWKLYFLVRCRSMPVLSDRLMLGMELCGTYSHVVVGNRLSAAFYGKAHRDAEGKLACSWKAPRISPALTLSDIEGYLAEAAGITGVKRARECARHLREGSASPGESVLALMATLPCALGGYGFRDMQLNPKLPVPKEKRHLTRFDSFHPDGFLRQLATDLEYESGAFHTSKRAIARDKARRNDIQALGIEVKDVTWEMLSHLDSLDLLFEQLLDKERSLGLDPTGRHRRAVHNPNHRAQRRIRLQELLPPWPYEA